MKKLLVISLIFYSALAFGQEPTKENAAKLQQDEQMREQLKVLTQVIRQSRDQCEINLSDIWSQANSKSAELAKLDAQFKTMKQDYDNVVKQLNEKTSQEPKAQESN